MKKDYKSRNCTGNMYKVYPHRDHLAAQVPQCLYDRPNTIIVLRQSVGIKLHYISYMHSKEGGNDNNHKLIEIHVTFGLLRCLGRDAILSETQGPEGLGSRDQIGVHCKCTYGCLELPD